MLSQELRKYGVVGAGGAGFPTYVKANSQVEFVLANGAECEPLIHKDFELMKQFPREIVSGMILMMEATQARSGKFGIKKKNQAAIDALNPYLKSKNIEFTLLGDFYPSGDEYELVYTATGRLIPPAGIPLEVGCVVNNVETLYNVHFANEGMPVTDKFVSIAGAVKNPCSFWTPIGVSFRELIALAGGATVSDFGIFVGGIMMGSLTFDLDDVVTKTTAGLIVLPKEHFLITRKSQPQESMNRIGKSACDQCSYCTEFCPRYLLGYEIVPHKVMRSLSFTLSGSDQWNQWAELCCGCGLCTLYACPEDLFPKEACDLAKKDMRTAGIKFVQKKEVRVHPMKESRRVPLLQLRKRLKVEEYEMETPFRKIDYAPSRVRIKLSQHAGKPAHAVVKEAESIRKGALVALVDEPDLGVSIHSSIDGTVRAVTDQWIEIGAKPTEPGGGVT
ncbi:MAG: 4Fe-4S dicluster domain-containing protein [Acidobacteriia bacterium]|nr:4Fe-4S dicluster domain-containing protein [Terriglobia bacterium]